VIDATEVGLTGVLYVAGSYAPPGRYRRVGPITREVDLPEGGRLPASFDGAVALYARVPPPPAVPS
jgi:hypothetical protein